MTYDVVVDVVVDVDVVDVDAVDDASTSIVDEEEDMEMDTFVVRL